MNSSDGHHVTNRQKRPRRNASDYTVACVSPLAVEAAPLRAMLDSIHEDIPSRNQCCAYILGDLEGHNVVIAILPSTGNNDSATAVTQLLNDYPSVKFALLVGIGAGVPGRNGKDDIRLGDVVVSEPTGCNGGVIQFDRGKYHTDGRFELTGHVNKPSPFLNAAVKKLKAQHHQEGNNLKELVLDMLRRNPNMSQQYCPPDTIDQLFQPAYEHAGHQECDQCDSSMTVQRTPRRSDQIQVHYGTVGSSNSVMRDSIKRDKLRDNYGVICIEMEAAAIMDHLPCLVIRGICDYGDSHKNKDWQPYAAAVAAAYARDFLRSVRPSETRVAATNTVMADAVPSQQHQDSTLDPSLIETFLASLAFTRMDARLHNISDPLPRTCKWMLDHPTYRLWIDSPQINDHNGFLWIKGKPGSGKSTIVKTLLAWEKKQFPDRAITSYFFNARAPGDLEKSSLGLYRSLCHQLLLAIPTIQSNFAHHFRTKEDAGVVESWTVNELQSFLNQAVQDHLKLPLTILIDALDEGSVDDIRQLVAFLEDLSLRASGAGVHLRICLSSRFYPHISVKAGLELTLNDQTGHQDDIRRYIKKRLTGSQSHGFVDLQDRIYQQSSSIFLWVVLVIPILNKVYDEGGTMNAMSACLEEIPNELDGLFANILGRNSEKISDCVNLLQWVLFSRRALKAMELYIAINVDSLPDDFDDTSTVSERLGLYLNNTSRGLTEMTKSNPPMVQFIHETVREFLKQSHGLQEIDPILVLNLEGNCHDRLKMDCLSFIGKYASRVLELHSVNKTDAKTRMACGKYDIESRPLVSFMKYCSENMFEHAEKAEVGRISQENFLRHITSMCDNKLKRWITIRNAHQQYEIRKYTQSAPMLYILAERGLLGLLKVHMRVGVSNSSTTERYETELQAACVAGHEDVALALIQAGSEINAEGGEWKNALFAAVRHKHQSLAKFLIQHGAKPSKESLRDFLYMMIARDDLPGFKLIHELFISDTTSSILKPNRSFLSCVCAKSRVPQEIRKWLSLQIIGIVAEIQLRQEYRSCESATILAEIGRVFEIYGLVVGGLEDPCYTVLDQTSSLGCKEVVQALLKAGVNVNSCGSPERCRNAYVRNDPLVSASENGWEEVVRLLLKHGTDLNARSGNGRTALDAASTKGHYEVVRLLLQNGAGVNVKSGAEDTALGVASANGHAKVVHLLLENGARVDIKNRAGDNAIGRALFNHSNDVVGLLLAAGADINAQISLYGNALQIACFRGNLHVVQLLLEAGAEVNAQSGKYGSALQAAFIGGDEKIVQLLLKAGADVNSSGGRYGNALQVACIYGDKHQVRLLLEAGADVNAQGGYHGSALQAACFRGNEDLVRLILEATADVKAQCGALTSVLGAIYQWGGRDGIKQLLIEAGANITAQSGHRNSALQVAHCP